MQYFDIFSKDAWHSVILQQFYNTKKRYFAKRKNKDKWIMNSRYWPYPGRDLYWYQ